MQQLKHNISKIADEIESEGSLEMYWDYRDRLSEEQVLKIITDEDGLNDVENELYESNIDYNSEVVRDIIDRYCKENNLELNEEEIDELRMECDGRFDLNIKGLLNNSQANIRVALLSNEDMIPIEDTKHSGTIEHFRKRFRNKFRMSDLKKEVLNCTSNYALITFYFRVSGDDILKLREEVLKGFITLRKGLFFGLFNSYEGSGSTLEMELLHSVTLNLKDWRVKDVKEAVIQRLQGNNSEYYGVKIMGDGINKYGINQVYGLSRWQEW